MKKTLTVESLTADAFGPFGFFASMIDPAATVIVKKPIEFYRDMLQLDLGGANIASLSVCRVEPRPAVVDVTEYHSYCGEGILPLDNDVVIHVGPACPDEELPLEQFRAFAVPKGTLVVLRPGVWHHAPMTMNAKPANVLIILPERTYANDCTVVNLPKTQRLTVKA